MKQHRKGKVPPLPVAAPPPPPLEVEVDLESPRNFDPGPGEEESVLEALLRRVKQVFGGEAGGQAGGQAGGEEKEREKEREEREQPEEKELERLREERRCRGCGAAPRETALRGCGHVALCRDCARSRRQCPLCRQPYDWTQIQEISFV